jgi:hypothetical protein
MTSVNVIRLDGETGRHTGLPRVWKMHFTQASKEETQQF